MNNLKTTLIATILTATAAFSANTHAAKGGAIEAEFNRIVPSTCHVVQSNKVDGLLTFRNEQAAPESIEVFSNTGQIELTFDKLKKVSSDIDEANINFSINDSVVTLGEVVEVNQGMIELAMSLDNTASDFAFGTELTATAIITIECEDELSSGGGNNGNNGNGNNDNGNSNQCKDFEDGMWEEDCWETDTDSDD